jgi:hypothetical protein
MNMRWWRRDFWYWVVLLVVAGLLAWMFIRTGQVGNQFQQLGTELGQQRAGATRVAEYKYVVDLKTKRYWPNEPRYAQAIDSANRVYVQDDATMKQWTGYKPGPK